MSDPKPTFSYIVSQLRDKYPSLGYVHLVEPRVQGIFTVDHPSEESNDFLREIWAPRPLISAGGYTRELSLEVAEKKGDLIAFGRPFIANVSTSDLLRCKNTALTTVNLIAGFAQTAQARHPSHVGKPQGLLCAWKHGSQWIHRLCVCYWL
jgi:NADPH2 dehydrogenase